MAVTKLKRQKLIGHKLAVYSGEGTPVDGTSGTGAGKVVPGSLYVDTTASMGRVYRNEGTKASPVWTPVGRTVSLMSLGRNGAGAITFTGAKVGDRVTCTLNLTDLTMTAANFESEITVADQIQQASATDLSAKKHLFIIQR